MGNTTIEPVNHGLCAGATPCDVTAAEPTPAKVGGTAAILATAREAAGLSLDQASEATKVKINYLEAIEQADYGQLPAPSYVIGFVRAYAGVLGLDAEVIAADYRADMTSPQGALRQANVSLHPSTHGKINALSKAPAGSSSPHDQGKVPVIAILALVSVCAFMFWAFFSLATSRDDRAIEVSGNEASLPAAPTPERVAPVNIPIANEPVTQVQTQPPSTSPVEPEALPAMPTLSMAPTVPAGPAQANTSNGDQSVVRTEQIASKKRETAAQDVSSPVIDAERAPALPAAIVSEVPVPDPVLAAPEPAPLRAVDQPGAQLPRVIRGGRDNRPSSRAIADTLLHDEGFLVEDTAQTDTLSSQDNLYTDQNEVGLGASILNDKTAGNILQTPVEEALRTEKISGFDLEDETVSKVIIQEAKLINSEAPRFPARCASRAKATESIMLSFTVSVLGTIENPQVLSSTNRCFNRAALQTLNRWRFNPRLENGRPTASRARTAIVKFQR